MNRINFIKKATVLSGVSLLAPLPLHLVNHLGIGSNEKIKFGFIGLMFWDGIQ